MPAWTVQNPWFSTTEKGLVCKENIQVSHHSESSTWLWKLVIVKSRSCLSVAAYYLHQAPKCCHTNDFKVTTAFSVNIYRLQHHDDFRLTSFFLRTLPGILLIYLPVPTGHKHRFGWAFASQGSFSLQWDILSHFYIVSSRHTPTVHRWQLHIVP